MRPAPDAEPCRRVSAAERDGTLASLLDELAGAPAHLEGCAACRAALARYRRLAGGLAALAAAAPPRRPDHVARALAAARAEASEVTPLRPRRRAVAALAPLLALAAAVALLWWLRRGSEAPRAPEVRFAFRVVKQRGPALRGDAQLGDELRVTLPPGSALWLYRNDRELLLVCPRDCRRDGAALTAARVLDAIGRYQLVWLSTERVPAPTGELEDDVAAARAAGATHELRELDVE